MKNDHHNSPFQLDFPHQIKRILPSPCNEYLGIEVANITKTLFYLYHLKSQRIIAKHIEEQKGLILRFFDQHQLLIQDFPNTKNPDQSNIKLCKWGEIQHIYTINQTRVIRLSDQWIEIPHPYFTGKTQFIDLHTGQQIEPTTPKVDSVSMTHYPTTYPTTSVYFQWFESFFNKMGITPIAQIEYLKLPDSMVISYYQMDQEASHSTMHHHICLVDQKGEIKNTFLLANALSAIGKNTFFVIDNQLVFITNYRTLNTYEI